jgi:DNA-binding NtrC family response regulator
MTPPRLPLAPDQAAAVAYVVRLALALERASGNVTRAAVALAMPRRTLDDHITRLGLAELRAAYSRADRQPRRA